MRLSSACEPELWLRSWKNGLETFCTESDAICATERL